MKLFSIRILLALLLLFSSSVLAISKQQAMNIAQQSNPGRVLGVKQSGNVYQVKILAANGDVRIIVIDASSGKVIR